MKSSIVLAVLAAIYGVEGRSCGKKHSSSVAVAPGATHVANGDVAYHPVHTSPATLTTTPPAQSATATEDATAQETSAADSTSGSSTSSGSSGVSLGSSVSGISTYYYGNLPSGTCSFTNYALPASMFGVAFSKAAWEDARSCGACVKVTGPGGKSLVAMIVDQCPECPPEHLDLYDNAFAALSAPSVGVIDITYEFVTCGISSPIVLKNKDGASQYWFSMQVVNANEPVEKMEVSTDGGKTWSATQRTYYNFFEKSGGFGTAVVDVKVTSRTGKVVQMGGVQVGDGTETTCGGNF